MSNNLTSQAADRKSRETCPFGECRPCKETLAILSKYQKMEEALNFYAQKKNYETESIWNGEDDVNVEKVTDDGDVARQALWFDPLSL